MLWLSRWVIFEVIRNCFSFALPRYLIGSKKLTQLSRLIRFQTKYNITRFSALQTVCFQFSSVQFLVLFPSFLWAVEITLILDSYTFFKTLSKVHRIMNWWSLLREILFQKIRGEYRFSMECSSDFMPKYSWNKSLKLVYILSVQTNFCKIFGSLKSDKKFHETSTNVEVVVIRSQDPPGAAKIKMIELNF